MYCHIGAIYTMFIANCKEFYKPADMHEPYLYVLSSCKQNSLGFIFSDPV